MLQVVRTDGTRPEWGTVGPIEEPWGCRLYTKEAQEELLDLYYRTIVETAPDGIDAEFTRERLGEEYTIGCVVWYVCIVLLRQTLLCNVAASCKSSAGVPHTSSKRMTNPWNAGTRFRLELL